MTAEQEKNITINLSPNDAEAIGNALIGRLHLGRTTLTVNNPKGAHTLTGLESEIEKWKPFLEGRIVEFQGHKFQRVGGTYMCID